MVYGIADGNGYPITDGISDIHEARQVAQAIANRRREPVEMCQHDATAHLPWPDGEWIEPEEG